jgi:hypothetical protein
VLDTLRPRAGVVTDGAHHRTARAPAEWPEPAHDSRHSASFVLTHAEDPDVCGCVSEWCVRSGVSEGIASGGGCRDDHH